MRNYYMTPHERGHIVGAVHEAIQDKYNFTCTQGMHHTYYRIDADRDYKFSIVYGELGVTVRPNSDAELTRIEYSHPEFINALWNVLDAVVLTSKTR